MRKFLLQTFNLGTAILTDLPAFQILVSCLPHIRHVSSEVWKRSNVEDEGDVLLKS